MYSWLWIAAAVVGFVLLQVLLNRYLGWNTRGTAPHAPTRATGELAAEPPAGGDETRTCEDCEAVNAREPGYRFCRECAAQLY
jgi:hypothetical protein